MDKSLKTRTLRALSWSFIETISQQGVQFIVGILLARLLFPEEFGLVGMLTIFVAVSQTFISSGFGAALIQKNKISQLDICSIFYFNIAVGLGITIILCLAAPLIANFYNQPILTSITRAMSLIIIISSFGVIQDTILIKEINFKLLTNVSMVASLLSGIIGVSMAVLGFGVWSLVAHQVSLSLFRTMGLWIFNSWRPTKVFSLNALREMFKFGSGMFISNLLNRFFANIYLLVIGKLFSANALGFFARAETLQAFPSQTLTDMVVRVAFPVFSTMQDDPVRFKRAMKKALATLTLINFPMMIGLAVIAHPLIICLFTEKWAPSIMYFQLLCVIGLLYPLNLINTNALAALGRSDIFLRLEIIKKGIIIINILITWKYGITVMIIGMIISAFISYYINSYYNGVLVNYSIREQLTDVFPYFIMGIIMGIVVYSIGFLNYPGIWTKLLAQIITGIILYTGLCRIFRLSEFMEIWNMDIKNIF